MFQHKGADGRAATIEGQRDCPIASLDVSVYKADRSIKPPASLKMQTGGSSRDLTLAALTSPVRMPTTPNSPCIVNSPMPSMRLDHAPSSGISYQETGLDSPGPNYGGDQHRLFPNFAHRNGAGVGAAGGPRAPGMAQLGTAGVQPPHPPLVSSVSSHIPGTRFPAQALTNAQYTKSVSTALSSLPGGLLSGSGSFAGGASTSGGGGGGSLSGGLSPCPSMPLPRAENVDETPMAAARASNAGNPGRLALPYLVSPRNPDSPTGGRLHGGSSSPMAEVVPEVVPEGPAEGEEGECGDEAGEEGDDVPGTVMLGINPALPTGMRRRRWCLDDYQVVKRMYKGATSAVYKAVCTRSAITVALKVYFLSRVPINVVHMVRREIDLHVPLVHKNVVTLYAAFQDEKHIVLVEEYAARGDLFGIHRSMNCRLTETQTSELILSPFLDALTYLHARGIMHRDIKPENILFTQDWVLKVADFGVSINVHDERAVTRTGTADYMAPEVERCPLKHSPEDNKDKPHLAYTTAIDIWSVGVLAYEMLVGFPPFVSNGAEEGAARPGMAAFMAEQATRKTLRFPASVSAAAKDFIMATLNESPGDRPTAQQLLKHPWLFRLSRRTSINTASRFSNSNLVAANH